MPTPENPPGGWWQIEPSSLLYMQANTTVQMNWDSQPVTSRYDKGAATWMDLNMNRTGKSLRVGLLPITRDP